MEKEITFRVWSPRRNANRFFPLRRFYLVEADGEYIQFEHVAVNRGGQKGDDYEVTAIGELAEVALKTASDLCKAQTVDGEIVIDRKELERVLRASTVNSKTRVLGKKGLRDDFKASLKVAA